MTTPGNAEAQEICLVLLLHHLFPEHMPDDPKSPYPPIPASHLPLKTKLDLISATVDGFTASEVMRLQQRDVPSKVRGGG